MGYIPHHSRHRYAGGEKKAQKNWAKTKTHSLSTYVDTLQMLPLIKC